MVSSWDHFLAVAFFNPQPDLPRTPAVGQCSEKVSEPEIEEARASLVKLIDSRLKWIAKMAEHVKRRDFLALDAESRSFSLPPADATDKLLRYDAHNDRQLYRAMDQLERLQRQRRGENVPPPLNVNLASRK